MSRSITVRTKSAGAPSRTCAGMLLGIRPYVGRLFLLDNPYPVPQDHKRLALVDDHDQTIHIWYCDKAPRWAQRMLATMGGE